MINYAEFNVSYSVVITKPVNQQVCLQIFISKATPKRFSGTKPFSGETLVEVFFFFFLIIILPHTMNYKQNKNDNK